MKNPKILGELSNCDRDMKWYANAIENGAIRFAWERVVTKSLIYKNTVIVMHNKAKSNETKNIPVY